VASARLIGDEGAAASDPQSFFRSPAFLGAERVTHTLALDGPGVELRIPVIVREIPAGGTDAISPYGFPGASGVAVSPPAPEEVDWSGTGLVSVFVRDRIGDPPCLAGGTVRSVVQVADPAQPSGIRKREREKVRRNRRRGWIVRVTPGPEVSDLELSGFRAVYDATMRRNRADEQYLYDGGYLGRALSSEGSWLLLGARGEEPPGVGAIAVAGDGYLHYYLGGTADGALPDTPMANVNLAMIELAAERGMPLNLGGGMEPGDSLEGFKRRFANRTAPFRTHEVVCDPGAYRQLCAKAGRPSSGFFPAYRG
jgi:hypothetical protein